MYLSTRSKEDTEPKLNYFILFKHENYLKNLNFSFYFIFRAYF